MPDIEIKPPFYHALSSRVLGISEMGQPLSLESAQRAALGIKKIILRNEQSAQAWERYSQSHPKDPAVGFFRGEKISLKSLT